MMTQMSFGNFSGKGFRKASYFQNLKIVDNKNIFQLIQKLKTYVDCKYYEAKNLDTYEWGNHFFCGE